MCGIVGILNKNKEPISTSILKKMSDTIRHRGPDGEGFLIDGFVGFAHRRLSVIDLSQESHQPMESFDSRYTISYNGEIYNYQEIRTKLIQRGYQFKSKGDTEVVLYSLIEWGVEALKIFNGMFAFSFYDKKEGKILLARDRYGIKPLYYSDQKNQFLFASEQKAIIAHPLFIKTIDKSALLEYFTFQNFFTEKTLFDSLKTFPAGHYGVIDINNLSQPLCLRSFWDFSFCETKEKLDEKECADEVLRLLNQAVKRQMVSDVEVGSYLSGGIDSASIVSIASANYNNLKTFTCGFNLDHASGIELNFDESDRAKLISQLLKTNHFEIILNSGDMEKCLKDLSWHLEEPRVGQSYPNYFVSKLASKHVKVILSGTGGDEIFGGYPWRYLKVLDATSFEDYINKYYLYWQRLLDNQDLRKLFNPIWPDVKDVWTKDIFRQVFSGYKGNFSNKTDFINASMYFEAKTFLHGLLIVEDKLSMSHSLETRLPFLDNDIVDFALKLPVHFKINNINSSFQVNENSYEDKRKAYFIKSNSGKKILREALDKFLPNSITKADKQGFSSPDASWFKSSNLKFINEKLGKNAKINEFFDSGTITSLLNDHFEGRVNRRLLIWSFLNVETWMENYL